MPANTNGADNQPPNFCAAFLIVPGRALTNLTCLSDFSLTSSINVFGLVVSVFPVSPGFASPGFVSPGFASPAFPVSAFSFVSSAGFPPSPASAGISTLTVSSPVAFVVSPATSGKPLDVSLPASPVSVPPAPPSAGVVVSTVPSGASLDAPPLGVAPPLVSLVSALSDFPPAASVAAVVAAFSIASWSSGFVSAGVSPFFAPGITICPTFADSGIPSSPCPSDVSSCSTPPTPS